MSMISEQIEELRLMAEMFANGEPYGNLLRRAANTIEMLSEKAREPKQGEWIPCSERLPEESGMHLCTCNDGYDNRTTFVKYQKRFSRWDLTGTRSYWKVIAWMPLPEPWKGADDE